jgi:cytochrome c oxidase subunit 2
MLNRIQSSLHSAGVQAARIESIWWLMLWVTLVVTVLVYAALAMALWRSSQRAGRESSISEPAALRRIGAAVGVSAVILFGLLYASVATSRALAAQAAETALVVEVTAYQWWWNVEYQHPDPSQRVRTANELHLPAGRTVAIKLLGADVIHSFWVPALHGKMDAIPGHSSVLTIRADEPGVYRGQCAEYCGMQHARMAIDVIVEAPDAFERWLAGQRQPAARPQSEASTRGLKLVEQGTCAMCHNIRGTDASGRTGPELTHVATRPSLAAGTLPNTRDTLRLWLANTHGVKPGTRMPQIGLGPDDLEALVSYLGDLR